MPHEILHSVKAIFFDLDNTLIQRDRSFKEVLPSWLGTRVPHLAQSEYEDQIEQIIRHDNRGFSDRHKFARWIKHNYQTNNLSADILSEFATAIALNIKRDDHLVGLISSLKKHYVLGVISNGSSQTQRLKLQRSGLCEVFDDDKIYLEGEAGLAKPDPALFNLVGQDQKISCKEILFVGDHPINDMQGASRVGMKTCWVRHRQDLSDCMVRPDMVVDTIEDFFKNVVYAEHE